MKHVNWNAHIASQEQHANREELRKPASERFKPTKAQKRNEVTLMTSTTRRYLGNGNSAAINRIPS